MLLYCSKELFDSSIIEIQRRKCKSCKSSLSNHIYKYKKDIIQEYTALDVSLSKSSSKTKVPSSRNSKSDSILTTISFLLTFRQLQDFLAYLVTFLNCMYKLFLHGTISSIYYCLLGLRKNCEITENKLKVLYFNLICFLLLLDIIPNWLFGLGLQYIGTTNKATTEACPLNSKYYHAHKLLRGVFELLITRANCRQQYSAKVSEQIVTNTTYNY